MARIMLFDGDRNASVRRRSSHKDAARTRRNVSVGRPLKNSGLVEKRTSAVRRLVTPRPASTHAKASGVRRPASGHVAAGGSCTDHPFPSGSEKKQKRPHGY